MRSRRVGTIEFSKATNFDVRVGATVLNTLNELGIAGRVVDILEKNQDYKVAVEIMNKEFKENGCLFDIRGKHFGQYLVVRICRRG